MKAKSTSPWLMVTSALATLWLAAPLESAEPVAFQLANGLRVRLVREREKEKVAIILGTRAGILNEAKGKPHLAHVVEHATVFDVQNPRLAETVQQWYSQGKVNGETLGEMMYFDMHVSSQELPTALAIQAARLGDMSYTDVTLQREIPRVLREVESLFSRPDAMGKFALIPFVQGALYGETNVPFRRLTRQIAVDDLRTFHAAHFQSDCSILSVIGDLDMAQTRKEIEKRFGSIPRPAQPPVARPALSPGFQRVTWDVPKRHFFLAWSIPGQGDADQPALYLAGMLLQQRLFELHQTGAISRMPVVHYDLDRILLVGCEVADDDGFPLARKAIIGEVTRLAQEGGLGDDALRGLVQGIEQMQKPDVLLDRQALPAGMSRTMARANLELQTLRHELIAGNFNRYTERLKKVEPSAARQAIAKWLTPDKVFAMRVVPSPGFDK